MISSAALVEIPSEAKLCLNLSRPPVLWFCSRLKGLLGPEDLLRCCLTEVEAEVRLQIVTESDSTLFRPLIELSLSLKNGEKHIVAPDVSNSVGMHLLLGRVYLFSTTGKMVFDGMLLMQKDLTLGIPTLHIFLRIHLEIVAIRLGLGNFWKSNLP